MKIDFDNLSQTQKIIAIRAFIAAGSPENDRNLDFELKVNGVVVDFIKFVDSFVVGYDHSTRMDAVKLIGKSVKLLRIHEALRLAEQKIIDELATTFNFTTEEVESIMSRPEY